ncbi:uncharacterized protein LOC143252880 isoform X2 [Tachypleus tridentatus]|uniref:uncharacterized protein LOC143252880 isoform X2 n=1 Tax=Tachypleus tridentatus TaxID=6853 RepID=UPI003FD580C7
MRFFCGEVSLFLIFVSYLDGSLSQRYTWETGIGKVVNGLKRTDGKIGEKARNIVNAWKQLVSSSENAEKEHQRNKVLEHSQNKKSKTIAQNSAPSHHASTGSKRKLLENEDGLNPSKYRFLHNDSSENYTNDYRNKSGNSRGSSRSRFGNKYLDSLTNMSEEDEEHEYVPMYVDSNVSHRDSHDEFSSSEDTVETTNWNSSTLIKEKESRDGTNHRSEQEQNSTKQGVVKRSLDSISFQKLSDNHHKKSSNNDIKTKELKNKEKAHKKKDEKNERHDRNSSVNLESQVRKSKAKGLTEDNYTDKGMPKTIKNTKKLLKMECTEGFTNSVASFEDCLGLNDNMKMKKKKAAIPVSPDKSTRSKQSSIELVSSQHVKTSAQASEELKKKSKSKNKESKQKVPHSQENSESKLGDMPVALQEPHLTPLDKVDVLSTLPEIQPNYRPLRLPEQENLPSRKKAATLTHEEAILFTSSKKDRTAVYSGRKAVYLPEVPTLYEACIRVLIDNMEGLAVTGGVPYELLKPVLERCSPTQLYMLEDYNPYLLENTDELWEVHCKRDFRGRNPDEEETWRELYLRLFDEREAKLKRITANISKTMSKYIPERQTKLAYVDTAAKPPREVARKQARLGTGLPVNHPMKAGPQGKGTPRPQAPVINAMMSSSSSSNSSSQLKKPKTAPLMQKNFETHEEYQEIKVMSEQKKGNLNKKKFQVPQRIFKYILV